MSLSNSTFVQGLLLQKYMCYKNVLYTCYKNICAFSYSFVVIITAYIIYIKYYCELKKMFKKFLNVTIKTPERDLVRSF